MSQKLSMGNITSAREEKHTRVHECTGTIHGGRGILAKVCEYSGWYH